MQKRRIPIKQLLVNHENPRFEPVKTEQKAIDLMMSEVGDKVFNLAKDIAEHDINPSRSLMVVEVGNSMFVPVDGNRRVVALKLLHQPDLAKDPKFRERFIELKKESGTSFPTEVECVVFPDKESAYRWVNLEHTGENKGVGVLSWDSEQKQRFAAQYAGKKDSRPIQLIDYADDNKIPHGKIDTTTLDRLLGTPSVRELIGVDFPNGILQIVKSKKQVLGNLNKLFVAMSAKDFKVGDVYTSAKATSWTEDVLGIARKAVKRSEVTKATHATAKPDPLDGDWITNRLYSVYPSKNRVKAILRELKGLKPGAKPNVCATSLRVLLELALYVFLKDKGIIATLIRQEKARIAAKNKKRKTPRVLPTDWAPNFQMTLNYLATHETVISDPLERRALKTFIGKKSSEPFLTELNQFIHNPSYDPTPQMVIDIWNKLGKPIFKTILT